MCMCNVRNTRSWASVKRAHTPTDILARALCVHNDVRVYHGRRVCVRRRVPSYLVHITGQPVTLALVALSISRLARSVCKLFIADAGAVILSLAADTFVWKIVLRFESYHYTVFAQRPYSASRIIGDTINLGFSTLDGRRSFRISIKPTDCDRRRGEYEGTLCSVVQPDSSQYTAPIERGHIILPYKN
ncbi:hypothetical protein EVAR_41507_1 [Eumeta japonica]|uniref:Uncharacterized protein n=1 Tax=Eumeta variegata TaxID=151549 RepID=A0A4C1X298_EUMVA|nr:hypothetical protein EVAR_41507_1 [Eumeta japonica]